MNEPTDKNPLFFSCDSRKYVAGENVIPEHGILYMFEGEMEMNDGEQVIRLRKGDTFFATKNSLFRFTKIASAEKPLKMVSIAFSQTFLRDFYSKTVPRRSSHLLSPNFLLQPNRLWNSLFNSLTPYVDMQDDLPADLCGIKQLEALYILRSLHQDIDNLLADFSMPGKIDLEEFMQKNYIFNLPLQQFAYLSGRSLSSFKRDFYHIFNSTPQRWLTLKRLELAHYLIKDKKIKPSEAYVEAGFENLSHFSMAFKSQFGYNPSQLV